MERCRQVALFPRYYKPAYQNIRISIGIFCLWTRFLEKWYSNYILLNLIVCISKARLEVRISMFIGVSQIFLKRKETAS